MIRNITGYGDGNGPYIAIHDGFLGVNTWSDFLPGSDRIMMDTHPYFAFDGQPNDSPLVADDGLGEPGGIWPLQACNSWAAGINTRFVLTFPSHLYSAVTGTCLFCEDDADCFFGVV